MKISTKGRYALRLMLELALHDANQWISVRKLRKIKKYPANIWNRLSPSCTGQCWYKASAVHRAVIGWPKSPKRSRWYGASCRGRRACPQCPAWRVKIAVLVGKIVLR